MSRLKRFLSESRASLPPGALGEVVGLLVAAAGDVVLEEPAHARPLVEAREDGHHHQALHRHRQVHADHLAELVGLAVEREVLALDLLVVLELGLEEAGHLHGGTGRARDAHAGEVVGLEDLLDAAVGDLVALAGLAVARHDDAVAVAQREDRGAVGHPGHARRRRPRARAPGSRCGDVAAQELGEARVRVVGEALAASDRRVMSAVADWACRGSSAGRRRWASRRRAGARGPRCPGAAPA